MGHPHPGDPSSSAHMRWGPGHRRVLGLGGGGVGPAWAVARAPPATALAPRPRRVSPGRLAQPLRAQARAQTFPAALRGGARAPPLRPSAPSSPFPPCSLSRPPGAPSLFPPRSPNPHLPICSSPLPISTSCPSSLPQCPHLPVSGEGRGRPSPRPSSHLPRSPPPRPSPLPSPALALHTIPAPLPASPVPLLSALRAQLVPSPYPRQASRPYAPPASSRQGFGLMKRMISSSSSSSLWC